MIKIAMLIILKERYISCKIKNNPACVKILKLYTTGKHNEVQTAEKYKKSSFLSQRLHNRILNQEEKSNNTDHLNKFKTLSQEDRFGKDPTLLQTSRSRTVYNIVKKENGSQLEHDHNDTMTSSHVWNMNKTEDNKLLRQDRFIERDKIHGKSNHFGLLSKDIDEETKMEHLEQTYGDEEEDEPHLRLSHTGRRYPPLWYGKKIEEFGRLGKIREAIDVLDTWMLKRDRVMPTPFCFTVLIGILGRAGYTKKSFQLFNQMKKMGIKPEDPTYTALFNACANSPWKSDGLSRATKLHALIQSVGYLPNLPVYHSMLKAYSRCGDTAAAFRLMDELCERYVPTEETFSFLLMACCSDPAAGFLHAIQVWRLMKQGGIKLELIHYNLLLRAVRDCGLGDPRVAMEMLNSGVLVENGSRVDGLDARGSETTTEEVGDEGPGYCTRDAVTHGRQDSCIDGTINDARGSVTRSNDRTSRSDVIVEPYDAVNSTDSVDSLSNEIREAEFRSGCDHDVSESIVTSCVDIQGFLNHETSSGRLSLLGGLRGLMDHLRSSAVTPDVKTFTLLVDVMEHTVEEEDSLMERMEQSGVEPDVDVFNLLIEKRCKRREFDEARAVLSKISDHKLYPNLRTFGCLALGCRKKARGIQLLKDIESCGLSANIEIYEILIYHCFTDFSYIQYLLHHLRTAGLTPSHKILDLVEAAIGTARHNVVKTEHSHDADSFYNTEYFTRGHREFCQFYPRWLRQVRWSDAPHPWYTLRHQADGDHV